MTTAPILSVRNFSAGYGKVSALTDIALNVAKGTVVTVVGPNGAGKSTLLNGIMGTLRGTGDVMLDGRSVVRDAVETRVMAGMSLVPERRELFADMSVLDNLQLGAFVQYRKGRKQPLEQLDWIYQLFPRLRERSGQLAGTLSGGERQMLAVGRALMASPRLLMLDEPSLGLAPRVVSEMLEVVGRLREHGVSTLLVEQNARAALRLADYGYVLENGRIVLEGPASELADNPSIVRSYMGAAKDTKAYLAVH